MNDTTPDYTVNLHGNTTARGTLSPLEIALTGIGLKPTRVIPSGQSKIKAGELLEISKKTCAISNSIKAGVILAPVIQTQ